MAGKRTTRVTIAPNPDPLTTTGRLEDKVSTANETAITKLEQAEEDAALVSALESHNVVTLYNLYDLTLVVGDPEAPRSVKAFRISSACLRQASDAFKAMLSGKFAESSKSFIRLPEDSPEALHIVLRIAHLEYEDLPSSLNVGQLSELASLNDKYLFNKCVKIILDSKDWIKAHKKDGEYLPVDASIQEWILIAHYFHFDKDYEYLVNSLALNLQPSTNNASLYLNIEGKKVLLRSDLPDVILDKLRDMRKDMLNTILAACRTAFSAIIKRRDCVNGKVECLTMCAGVVLQAYCKMGLLPLPFLKAGSANPLHRSVRFYWATISSISDTSHFCRAPGIGFKNCMASLSPKGPIDNALRKYKSSGLFNGWAGLEP